MLGWANQGVPIKIACHGIDRYFERYYAKGPRRRPVRIEFCEADVLDAFDEWRRAVGIASEERLLLPPLRVMRESSEARSAGTSRCRLTSTASLLASRRFAPGPTAHSTMPSMRVIRELDGAALRPGLFAVKHAGNSSID